MGANSKNTWILFHPNLNIDGTVNMEKRGKSKDLRDSLKRDLLRYHLYQGDTPQSFQHGGTVDSLKKGRNLQKTMALAFMKNTSTAMIYAKGLKHLFPDLFQWNKIGIDITETS